MLCARLDVEPDVHVFESESAESLSPVTSEFSLNLDDCWSYIYFVKTACVQLGANIAFFIQTCTFNTRSANYTPPGHYIKCFHNSEHILALHNHFPRACLGDTTLKNLCKQCLVAGCKGGKMLKDLGHLQHYR